MDAVQDKGIGISKQLSLLPKMGPDTLSDFSVAQKRYYHLYLNPRFGRPTHKAESNENTRLRII